MFSKRLLVIDDDNDITELVSRIAIQSGFVTRTAHNDLSFISIYEHFKPDVVVTDIVMPGMDGFEILQFLCARGSTARIVLISGNQQYYEMAGKLAENLGLNVQLMIAKPFRLHELRMALREIHYCLPDRDPEPEHAESGTL